MERIHSSLSISRVTGRYDLTKTVWNQLDAGAVHVARNAAGLRCGFDDDSRICAAPVRCKSRRVAVPSIMLVIVVFASPHIVTTDLLHVSLV
jgi:hypothetical protein